MRSAGAPDFIEVIHVSSEWYWLRRSSDPIFPCPREEIVWYLLSKLVKLVCFSLVKGIQMGLTKMID